MLWLANFGSPCSGWHGPTRGSVQDGQDQASHLVPGDYEQQANTGGRDCRGRRKWRHSNADVCLWCAEDVDSADQRRGGQHGRRGNRLPKR